MTRTARARRTPDRGTARQSESPSSANEAAPQDRSTDRPGPTARGSDSGRVRRVWRYFLHDRSVRSRIAAVIIIPLIATLVFGVLFVSNSVQQARASDDVEQLAEVGLLATTLSHRIQDERDTTALTDAGITGEDALTEARAATDTALADLNVALDDIRDSDLYSPVAGTIATYDREVNRISSYREMADKQLTSYDISTSVVYQRLGEAVVGVVTIAGSAADDPDTARRMAALGDISSATLSASQERGLFVFHLDVGDEPTPDQQRASAIFRDQQALYIDSFLDAFTFRERLPYANDISTGSRASSAIRGAIAAGLPTVTTKEAWYQASTTRIDAFREIERQLGASITANAQDKSTQAWTRSAISAGAVLVVLALTVALATYVARSIVGPLSRLRQAALDTASHGLPGLVDRIRQDGPAVARQTQLAVTAEGKDEIGQVATAFNDVQKTAVEVASDQALLRQNLDTIVVNLSRRTQSLIDRQLGEIEGLESRERDPEQLSTLFRIDHMATRVRRHAESLLVLAGVEEMRKHGAATPVLDVVRTAVGEVEQYPRVKFGVMPTDLVASVGVDDVAHLLAELIDNATEFSSPSTPVSVTSQPLLGGGLRIQVTDVGLGVPPEQLAALNERLSNPGDIDVAASRTLGLYVVARLANKHGIRVRLEPGPTAGVVAQVDLPAHLILSPLDTTEGAIPPVTEETPVAQVDDAAGPASILNSGALPDDGLPRRQPTDLPRRAGAPETVQANAEGRSTESIWGPPVHQGETPWTPPAPSSPNPPTPQDRPAEPAARPAPGTAAGAPLPPSTVTPLVGPGRDQAEQAAPSAPHPSTRQPQPAARPEPPAPAPAAAQASSPEPSGSGGGLYDGPGTQEQPVVSANWGQNGTPSRPSQPTSGQRPPAPSHEPIRPPERSAPAAPSQVPPRPLTADAVVDQSLREPSPSLAPGDSPIYEAVRSAWFSDGGPNRDFSSPADAGWQRAAEALRSAEEAASARRVQHREAQGERTRPRPEPSRRTPTVAAPSAAEPLLRSDRPAPSRPARPESTPERLVEPPAASREPEAPAAAWTSGGTPGPAAEEPMLSPSGLPVRRRGASLVPGSIGESAPETPVPATARHQDAGSVASTLSSLQRGVSRGRDETGGWVPNRPSDAERSNP